MFDVSILKTDDGKRKIRIFIQDEPGFEDLDETLNINDDVARYFLLLIGSNMAEIVQAQKNELRKSKKRKKTQ